MKEQFQQFKSRVSAALADAEMQENIQSARANYLKAFRKSSGTVANLETIRKRAAFTRWKSIENLDKYLIEFESNFIRKGGKVIWAQDNLEAVSEIIGIINRSGSKLVVKSKTLTSEEIGLDEALLHLGKEWVETDLGQYILQLSDEKPSHMVMPAIHKSAEDISQLFSNKLGIDETHDIGKLVHSASNFIKEKYKTAGVGITGANFLIANPGAISITENEGNAWITSSKPKVHIVIAGIDKIIPNLNDLSHLLPLLSMYGTGQPLTAYNSIISGPKKAVEKDGPEEMYVILIDNGRSKVLDRELERKALYCIRCGSCLYNDPIFRVIGGQAYQSTWMGPIGTAVLPIMDGQKATGFLSELTTLSGADSEGCPVNIPFNKILLNQRKKQTSKSTINSTEKMFFYLWKKAMLKREIINWKNIRSRNFLFKKLFLKSPDNLREMRLPAKVSFNESYRQKFK